LNELEDTVIQQDNQIAALSERVRTTQQEVEKWRRKEETATVAIGTEKEKLIEGNTKLDRVRVRLTGGLTGYFEGPDCTVSWKDWIVKFSDSRFSEILTIGGEFVS